MDQLTSMLQTATGGSPDPNIYAMMLEKLRRQIATPASQPPETAPAAAGQPPAAGPDVAAIIANKRGLTEAGAAGVTPPAPPAAPSLNRPPENVGGLSVPDAYGMLRGANPVITAPFRHLFSQEDIDKYADKSAFPMFTPSMSPDGKSVDIKGKNFEWWKGPQAATSAPPGGGPATGSGGGNRILMPNGQPVGVELSDQHMADLVTLGIVQPAPPIPAGGYPGGRR